MESAETQRFSGVPIPLRAVRFGLHWLIKLLVLACVLAWRLKPVVALVFLVAAGVWWVGPGGGSIAGFSLRPLRAATYSEQFSAPAMVVPPSAAPEQYLRGQSRFDAQMMWDSLSDEMKISSRARGGAMTFQRLQQQLDEAKNNGLRYDQANYIGGFRSSDGRAFYLYVVAVTAGGSGTQYIPYTFTVGKEGKILSID